jgi:type II secretory pathway pseudopilin PulG
MRQAAFTMIEIAISLAVIGFALVAIIGILPTGMNVQRENREETIINQDAMVLLDAIRYGARGMDDLTNYVEGITISTRELNRNMQTTFSQDVTYTTTNSTSPDNFGLLSGLRIVGLLSTPKYQPPIADPRDLIVSNYVVATIRAMSGLASEKVPQVNRDIHDLSFRYKVFVDIVPYAPILTNGFTPGFYENITNNPAFSITNNPAAHDAALNSAAVMRNTQANLYDVRLTFRWPVLPNGSVGGGRQVFRVLAGGALVVTRDQPKLTPIFFLEPRTYVKAP